MLYIFNTKAMATVVIDEKTAKGRKLIEFLKTLDFVTFDEKTPSESLKRSMNEAKEGKVIRHKSTQALLAKLKK